MSEIEEFQSTIVRIASVMQAPGIRFHLTGGAAIAAYSDPRVTYDIDIVICREELSDCLQEFLKRTAELSFYSNEQTVRESIKTRRQFQLFDQNLAIKLGFYPRELVEGELERTVHQELVGGLVFPLASRADLAISKLVWISKGSHKSRRDFRQILLRATPEELTTVRHYAQKHELDLLMDEVLRETDEVDF